jgi:hypothetical protein
MFHVIRNADGTIQSLSRQQQPNSEIMEEHCPEVLQFFAFTATEPAFNESDAEFVRVIEDLIDTLILKNVIRHTDLPSAAQRKLMLRQGLRSRMQGALNLLGDDEQIL